MGHLMSAPIIGKFCLFTGLTLEECAYPARNGEPGRRLLGLIVSIETKVTNRQFSGVQVLTRLGTIDYCQLWESNQDDVVEVDDLADLINYGNV